MTNWMNKLSIAACALLLAGSVACGNNDENNDNNSPCADGEVNVAGGSLAAGCYKDCTANASACGATQECKTVSPSQKLCVEKKADTNNPPGCEMGQVKASWKGEEKCYQDCSADANVCTGDNECKTAGSESICVPKEVINPGCADGEVETVVGGGTAQCYKKCTGNPDCAADGKVCKQDDGGANMVCVEESQLAMVCRQYCEITNGSCFANTCGGLNETAKMVFGDVDTCINGTNGQPGCEVRAAQNPDFLTYVQQFAAAGCDSTFTKVQFCYGTPAAIMASMNIPAENKAALVPNGDWATECGCTTPDYTKGCTMDSDCPSTILSSCVAEDPNTMNPPGGLCLYGACQVDNPMANTVYPGDGAGCGPDTYCLIQDQNGQLASSCVSPCSQNSDCPRAVTGDADSGYVCVASLNFGNGQYVGQCRGACASDADCNDPNNPNALPQVCGDDRTCELACDAANAGSVCSVTDPNTNMMRELAGTVCTATQKDATKFGCKIAQPYTSPF